MKYFIILSFISVFAIVGFEVPKESKNNIEVVLWKKDKKLNWEDFKGTPKSGSPFSAECNWEINYSYSYNPYKVKKLEFDVNCFFNASKSWVRKQDRSTGLLAHEQVHFDIAEFSSRRLRKILSEKEFNKATFKEDLIEIFSKTLLECDSIQNAYDEETNHGLIKSKQSNWEKNIQSEILNLRAFENSHQVNEIPFEDQNIFSKLISKFNIF